MTLEQEAEEYAQMFDNRLWAKRAFKAGANSKWVQAEKIKAQIEVIQRAKSLLDLVSIHRELEQQLKQLEDETEI